MNKGPGPTEAPGHAARRAVSPPSKVLDGASDDAPHTAQGNRLSGPDEATAARYNSRRAQNLLVTAEAGRLSPLHIIPSIWIACLRLPDQSPLLLVASGPRSRA